MFGVVALPKTFLLPFVSLGFGVGSGDFNLPSDLPLPENFQQVENSNNNNSLNKNLQASDLQQNTTTLTQPIVETKSNTDLNTSLSVAGLTSITPFINKLFEYRTSMSLTEIQTFIATLTSNSQIFKEVKLLELWEKECDHTIKILPRNSAAFPALKNESQLEKISNLNTRTSIFSKKFIRKDYRTGCRNSDFYLNDPLPLHPEVMRELDNWTFYKLNQLEKQYPYKKT